MLFSRAVRKYRYLDSQQHRLLVYSLHAKISGRQWFTLCFECAHQILANTQPYYSPYILIKIHEVGDHFDVGMVDPCLANDLLQHVAQASGEDEHGHVVLKEPVKELLIALPAWMNRRLVKGTVRDSGKGC